MCYVAATAGATFAIYAGLAITAASTAYTFYEQKQQTKYNNKFQEDMAEEGNKLANANFKNQANAENLHQSQENDAAVQQKQENQRRASEAKATARVASGEAGVAGISIDALQADFSRQEAMFNGSIDTNRDWSLGQSRSNMAALRAGALDRIASTTPNLQAPPSYLGAGLRIGSQGLDTYTRYRTN